MQEKKNWIPCVIVLLIFSLFSSSSSLECFPYYDYYYGYYEICDYVTIYTYETPLGLVILIAIIILAINLYNDKYYGD